jgi:hypothetical protein
MSWAFRSIIALLFVSLVMPIAVGQTKEPPPGKRLIMADYSKRNIAILAADGTVEWEYKIGDLHDLHVLPDGNVLFQTSYTRLLEVEPKSNRVVWQYDSATANGNAGRKVEVHAFQRLPGGATMIAESGPARLIEVDSAGKLLREIKLQVAKPHPHRDTRLVRKLDSGNYLVCHEGEGAVREYDPAGKVVWDYPVPLFGEKLRGGHGPEAFGNACFAAVRLKNGNTLLSTGNGHSVLEVTPSRDIVWSLKQDELPGVRLAWVTTLQVLPNGNIVLGNCHAGRDQPQLVEVDRDRKLVWSYRNWQRFGDAVSNSQILDVVPVVR